MGTDRQKKRDRERGPAFLSLPHYVMRSAAWRALSPYARALYIEIRARYNGRNNGDIPMSYRDAEELLAVSNKPIPAAFRDLQEHGFISQVQKGTFSWKMRFEGKGRATTWRLTDLPQDYPQSGDPTKDFMRWQPTENKTRHAESGRNARPKRAISDNIARLERTNDTPRAGHSGENAVQHGTLKAGTCNIPYTLPAEQTGEQPSKQRAVGPKPIGQISAALLRTRVVRGGAA